MTGRAVLTTCLLQGVAILVLGISAFQQGNDIDALEAAQVRQQQTIQRQAEQLQLVQHQVFGTPVIDCTNCDPTP